MAPRQGASAMQPHIRTCHVRGIVECAVCCDSIPMPTGCLSWVMAVLAAFRDVHCHCCHPTAACGGAPGVANDDCTGFVGAEKK